MSERLKEIKNNAKFLTDEDGDFIDTVQLYVDEYAYLYEQAKLTERYKQALEEIRSEASGYMSNSAAQRLYDIANEALEGEE